MSACLCYLPSLPWHSELYRNHVPRSMRPSSGLEKGFSLQSELGLCTYQRSVLDRFVFVDVDVDEHEYGPGDDQLRCTGNKALTLSDAVTVLYVLYYVLYVPPSCIDLRSGPSSRRAMLLTADPTTESVPAMADPERPAMSSWTTFRPPEAHTGTSALSLLWS